MTSRLPIVSRQTPAFNGAITNPVETRRREADVGTCWPGSSCHHRSCCRPRPVPVGHTGRRQSRTAPAPVDPSSSVDPRRSHRATPVLLQRSPAIAPSIRYHAIIQAADTTTFGAIAVPNSRRARYSVPIANACDPSSPRRSSEPHPYREQDPCPVDHHAPDSLSDRRTRWSAYHLSPSRHRNRETQCLNICRVRYVRDRLSLTSNSSAQCRASTRINRSGLRWPAAVLDRPLMSF